MGAIMYKTAEEIAQSVLIKLALSPKLIKGVYKNYLKTHGAGQGGAAMNAMRAKRFNAVRTHANTTGMGPMMDEELLRRTSPRIAARLGAGNVRMAGPKAKAHFQAVQPQSAGLLDRFKQMSTTGKAGVVGGGALAGYGAYNLLRGGAPQQQPQYQEPQQY